MSSTSMLSKDLLYLPASMPISKGNSVEARDRSEKLKAHHFAKHPSILYILEYCLHSLYTSLQMQMQISYQANVGSRLSQIKNVQQKRPPDVT